MAECQYFIKLNKIRYKYHVAGIIFSNFALKYNNYNN